MHGNVFRGGFVTRIFDHDADTRAVQVGGLAARSVKAPETSKTHVLADLADQALAHILQRRPVTILRIGQRTKPCQVRRIVRRDQFGRGVGKREEGVVLGDEVGLAIHLDQGARIAVTCTRHHTFGGDASSGLAGLGAQLHAQQFFGPRHVTGSLGQGALALHHRGIGLAAQFRHHTCCYRNHFLLRQSLCKDIHT